MLKVIHLGSCLSVLMAGVVFNQSVKAGTLILSPFTISAVLQGPCAPPPLDGQPYGPVQFTLWTDPTNNNSAAYQLGNTITNYVIIGENRGFTTTLDFGPYTYTDYTTVGIPATWVQIAFQSMCSNQLVVLSPRIKVTGSPYSAIANTALTALTASNLPTMRATPAWLNGVLGGYSANTNLNNAYGVAILGGGTNGQANIVSANYGTIAGGFNNSVQGIAAAISGGSANIASGDHAGVASGEGNVASGSHSFVGSGQNNTAVNYGDVAVGGAGNIAAGDPSFIGAGSGNIISGTPSTPLSTTANAGNSFIVAGISNIVSSINAGIGGGSFNWIQTNADYSFVGAGNNNTIQVSAGNSVIGGGAYNRILPNATFSTIAGGLVNTIQTNSVKSSIGGGSNNIVLANSPFASIGGGAQNSAFAYATVGGGSANTASGQNSTISGGSGNSATAVSGTVGGGFLNQAYGQVDSTVAGGSFNTASNSDAAVGGGTSNLVLSVNGTIPGGRSAVATDYAQLAYSAGQFQTPGDSQYSLYVLRGITTNSFATNSLYLDGSSLEISLPTNRACFYSVSIVGIETAPAHRSAGFHIRGLANGASSTFVNVSSTPETLSLPFSFTTLGTWISVTGGKLHVQVSNGTNVTTIRWTATVQTAEVAY